MNRTERVTMRDYDIAINATVDQDTREQLTQGKLHYLDMSTGYYDSEATHCDMCGNEGRTYKAIVHGIWTQTCSRACYERLAEVWMPTRPSIWTRLSRIIGA